MKPALFLFPLRHGQTILWTLENDRWIFGDGLSLKYQPGAQALGQGQGSSSLAAAPTAALLPKPSDLAIRQAFMAAKL